MRRGSRSIQGSELVNTDFCERQIWFGVFKRKKTGENKGAYRDTDGARWLRALHYGYACKKECVPLIAFRNKNTQRFSCKSLVLTLYHFSQEFIPLILIPEYG